MSSSFLRLVGSVFISLKWRPFCGTNWWKITKLKRCGTRWSLHGCGWVVVTGDGEIPPVVITEFNDDRLKTVWGWIWDGEQTHHFQGFFFFWGGGVGTAGLSFRFVGWWFSFSFLYFYFWWFSFYFILMILLNKWWHINMMF